MHRYQQDYLHIHCTYGTYGVPAKKLPVQCVREAYKHLHIPTDTLCNTISEQEHYNEVQATTITCNARYRISIIGTFM